MAEKTLLTKLPGIGKVLEEQLCQVGIDSPEALRSAGSREAWLRIRAIDPSACINRLYGLECAVRGLPKGTLPEEAKAELCNFYKRHK